MQYHETAWSNPLENIGLVEHLAILAGFLWTKRIISFLFQRFLYKK